MTNQEILALPMRENDANAKTIRDYLKAIVRTVWIEDECFSGKRPFGNSCWKSDVEITLIEVGVITGIIDEDGCIEDCDSKAADRIILAAIDEL